MQGALLITLFTVAFHGVAEVEDTMQRPPMLLHVKDLDCDTQTALHTLPIRAPLMPKPRKKGRFVSALLLKVAKLDAMSESKKWHSAFSSCSPVCARGEGISQCPSMFLSHCPVQLYTQAGWCGRGCPESCT